LWLNAIDLPTNEYTIANYLQNAGYNTAYFGKIHISEKQDEHKLSGHFGFSRSYFTSDWRRDYYQIVHQYDRLMNMRGWYGSINNRRLHHEEVITDLAIKHLKTARSPHFTVVSYVGPHPPYTAPPPYNKLYGKIKFDIPRESEDVDGGALTADDWHKIKAFYYRGISWIDSNIGRLLAAVDDDTIIIFTSDHGDILGDHGHFSKGMYTYEGNTRVPLLIKAPMLKPDRYKHLVQHIDILPTILTMIDQPIPLAAQGRSLFEAFSTGDPINDYVLSMMGWQPKLRMIRDTRYKYWIYGTQEYLFDLITDPEEEKNLRVVPEGKRRWKILNKMRFKLMRALIAAEDPTPRPYPHIPVIPYMNRG